MPSHPASTQLSGASFRHFFGYLARMRFFTLSVILHGIMLAFVAGMFWYEPVPPQSDYLAHTGAGLELPGVPTEEMPTDDLTPPAETLTFSSSTIDASPPPAWHLPLESTTTIQIQTISHVLVQTPNGPTCVMRTAGPRNVVIVIDGLERANGGTTVSKQHAALEREAAALIQGMSEKDRVGVVVYGPGTQVLGDQCVIRTDTEKKQAIAWLTGAGPLSGNFPANFTRAPDVREALGLGAAFALGPSEIYFFSNGTLTPQTTQDCLRAVENWRKWQWFTNIPVHTITAGAEADGAFLKDLASRTGGTFRAVEPDSGK